VCEGISHTDTCTGHKHKPNHTQLNHPPTCDRHTTNTPIHTTDTTPHEYFHLHNSHTHMTHYTHDTLHTHNPHIHMTHTHTHTHTHPYTHTHITYYRLGYTTKAVCIVILQLLLFMGHFIDYGLLKKFTI